MFSSSLPCWQGRTYTPFRCVRSAEGILHLSVAKSGNGTPLNPLQTWRQAVFQKRNTYCRHVHFRHAERSYPIAIYHLSIKIISRGKGKSAVAAAAYRAGEKITNDYDGVTHDYTHKGGVTHTEILLPDNAPLEFSNRATLWNAVESIEKNKNSQLAREIEIALPTELSAGQNLSLVHEYCKQNFVGAGMCADICIHDKNDGNPHAHIMLTMRPFEQDGNWAAKSKKEYILDENGDKIRLTSGEYKSKKVNTVDWNEQTKAEEWRSSWADLCNHYLEQNNHSQRIDHRSYERQGVEQIPTIHLGVAAYAMEKRGIKTHRGNMNRQIQVTNSELRQLKARIDKLKKWLKEELEGVTVSVEKPSNSIPSSGLVEMLGTILSGQEHKGNRQKIGDLKTIAKAIAFLQTNNIAALPELRQGVIEIQTQHRTITDKIKATERRLSTLAEHIQHAENYLKHRDIWGKYKALKPKKQEELYQSHSAEIILFESAEKYLKEVLNGREKIPLSSWKSETKKLAADTEKLYQTYYRLKDEVKEVEGIQRCIEQAVQNNEHLPKSRKDKGVER